MRETINNRGAETTTSSEQRRLQLAKEEIEKLKNEKEMLIEKNNELEIQAKAMTLEQKKLEQKKDLERYKSEKVTTAERIKKS